MLYPINRSIPVNTDQALVTWSLNFSTVLTAAPATYGTDAPTAVAVAAAQLAYSDAYDLAGVVGRVAINPAGYTKPNRAALYAARAAMLAIVRPLASQIQTDLAISDEDKLLIGVQPKNFNRTPTYAPATAPVLAFLGATTGVHRLTFADELTPSKKLMPIGSVGIDVYVGVGVAPVPLADCSFSQRYSRWPIVVTFDPGDAGKTATYFARWAGRRGDVGPWSPVASAVIV